MIHPFHPSASSPSPITGETSRTPVRNRFSWSGVGGTPVLDTGGKGNPYEISLDVGDEFFAFEEYEYPAVEGDGRGEVWYRG